MRRCVRCVMPEGYPEVTFDSEGVCSFCRFFEKKWTPWVRSPEDQARSEAKLRRIFADARAKRRPYDALLGISGGKDSSYMLYLCRQVYGLNVLTFTRDNGFTSDQAKQHIDRLVDIFEVPHIYCTDPFGPELASVFLRKTGNFCAPCELLSFNIHAVIAREYDIPVIVSGSSSRTDGTPPKELNPWDPWYFGNVLKNEPYRERLRCSFFSRNYVLREGLTKTLRRRRILTMPDYVDWDEDKIANLFATKYGILFGNEHSDCIATEIAEYLYRKKCNGSGPKTVKYSLLVRGGKMDRDEALNKLAEGDTDELPPKLDLFLQLVGMTRRDFEDAVHSTPGDYLTGMSKLFNALRRHIRRQAA